MKPSYLTLMLAIWIMTLINLPDATGLLSEYWHFMIIGLIGAIVANSTGAGGGIIFIPAFAALGLDPAQTLATSILIQCFGMTSGSLAWLSSLYKGDHFSAAHRPLFSKILLVSAPSAIAGVILAQYVLIEPPFQMVDLFRGFSVLFGATLLYITTGRPEHAHSRQHLANVDKFALAAVSIIGGMITSWISIGIGEMIAIYLILRHVPVMLAVCIGVCMSSLTVLTAAPFHVIAANPVWEILLFAAPAAIIGGSIARYLSFRLGPVRLKIFFATWVLVTGLVM